jgi:molybdopterin biosynthesis enzyme MoaB
MPPATPSASKEVVTAALLVVGGKILSGRTKDQNIGYIAEYLTALGIDLKEVRVVGDEETRAQHECGDAPAMSSTATFGLRELMCIVGAQLRRAQSRSG